MDRFVLHRKRITHFRLCMTMSGNSTVAKGSRRDRGRSPARRRGRREEDGVLGRILRMAIGGTVGLLGGVILVLAVVVARARLQVSYLESIEGLLHWQSMPLLITPLVGVMFGGAGRRPLIASIVGSAAGLAVGALGGAVLGTMLSDAPEWPWAGGVMGAGCGLTVGGLFFGVLAWTRQDTEAARQRAALMSR